MRGSQSITRKAFSELLEFASVLADKTEGPLSSVYKFDTFNQNTVDEKTIKIFFCPVCTESFPERVEKYCGCGNRLDAKELEKSGHYDFYTPDVFPSFLSIQENRQIVIEFLTKDKSTSIFEGKMKDTTDSVRYRELRDLYEHLY